MSLRRTFKKLKRRRFTNFFTIWWHL